MYDTQDRRWISPDIIKGVITNPLSLVRYLYCDNNPLIFIDFTGLVKINTINIQTAITGKDINGSNDTYIGVNEALALYGIFTGGGSKWTPKLNNLYWETSETFTKPIQVKNYVEFYNKRNNSNINLSYDAWRVNGIYFMKLDCFIDLLNKSNVNTIITEKDILFRTKDWTAEKGYEAGLTDLFNKFLNGPNKNRYMPSTYNYEKYTYLGTYHSIAHENALKFKKTTYWKNVLQAASTAPSAWSVIQSIPDGYTVGFGQYQIPVKPVAFAGVWTAMGIIKWLGLEDLSPPDDF